MNIILSESGVLKLGGALEIASGNALREALTECLERAPAITIDLSEVETCDSASLQLFCAARRSAAANGQSVVFAPLSDGVIRTATAIGLALEDLTSGSLPAPQGDLSAV